MAFRLLAFATLPSAEALVQPRRLAGECQFANPPHIPYFWDPTCQDPDSLGCLADGLNPECRFCGKGQYREVFCPASWCEFDARPMVPYYWDIDCSMGKIGCLADGKSVECRYCGEFPYNGSVPCPSGANAIVPEGACRFDNPPETPFFWDPTCEEGQLGCKADEKHVGCRFCGRGAYASVSCPASLCVLPPAALLKPSIHKYYWEPQCWNTSDHILGCLADGIHKECRFCGGSDYAEIACPE